MSPLLFQLLSLVLDRPLWQFWTVATGSFVNPGSAVRANA